MTVNENHHNGDNNKIMRAKNVLVGVHIDTQSREVLSWALVKVADPGDRVVAIHVCRNSDQAPRDKLALEDYLDVYQGLCSVKKVELSGKIIIGSSVRKALVSEAEKHNDVTLVLGVSKKSNLGSSIRGSTGIAKYCSKKLSSSSTTDVLAVHNGKIIFTRCTRNQPPGLFRGDPKPSLREAQSEFGDSECCDTETVLSGFESIRVSHESRRSESFSLAVHEERRSVSRSCSVLSRGSFVSNMSMDRNPGWPLLRRSNSGLASVTLKERNTSVVQWVMSLPDRTISEESRLENESILVKLSSFSEVPREGLRRVVEENSFGCKWFSLDFLKNSTSEFSSERLVGKGGSNRVYKGIFPSGKNVAVKVLESSKQIWKDFAVEFDVMSSLKHKHIPPLLGICVEDDALISVYDFFPKGSLDGNLHGKSKDKQVLSWEVRYRIAVGICEALHYLHKECPQPVIHRDIKSSNILLSNSFEPKLSDFGLAIWAPKNSNFITEGDVVGTFGYIAPEYFMYGKVSDKIDVYAFGIVLLELLSGRRPIGSDFPNPKGQQSLVMWAKPMIEKWDLKGLLDPNLDGKVDEIQVHRMALAASLCITRSARLRPSIERIMKLLKGDKEAEKWDSYKNDCQMDSSNRDDDNNNDDEVYPDSSTELHLGVALNDVDDDATSFSSSNNTNNNNNNLTLEDYFKGRWSRSSSFD